MMRRENLPTPLELPKSQVLGIWTPTMFILIYLSKIKYVHVMYHLQT